MSAGVIGKAKGLATGVESDVERVFGDVDADAVCYGEHHLFSVLVLSRGLHPRVSVQAAGKREGWSNYRSVLSTKARYDPSPLAVGSVRRLSRRRPILPDRTPQIMRQGPLPRPFATSEAAVCYVRFTSIRDVASAQMPDIRRRRGERVRSLGGGFAPTGKSSPRPARQQDECRDRCG